MSFHKRSDWLVGLFPVLFLMHSIKVPNFSTAITNQQRGTDVSTMLANFCCHGAAVVRGVLWRSNDISIDWKTPPRLPTIHDAPTCSQWSAMIHNISAPRFRKDTGSAPRDPLYLRSTVLAGKNSFWLNFDNWASTVGMCFNLQWRQCDLSARMLIYLSLPIIFLRRGWWPRRCSSSCWQLQPSLRQPVRPLLVLRLSNRRLFRGSKYKTQTLLRLLRRLHVSDRHY
jgi:hypothetical protein